MFKFDSTSRSTPKRRKGLRFLKLYRDYAYQQSCCLIYVQKNIFQGKLRKPLTNKINFAVETRKTESVWQRPSSKCWSDENSFDDNDFLKNRKSERKWIYTPQFMNFWSSTLLPISSLKSNNILWVVLTCKVFI